MVDTEHFDIVIVGAGIAGTAMAVALGESGLSVAVVEARPTDDSELPGEFGLEHFDPRVSALTPRSRRLLEQLGCWESIQAYRHCAYRHMTVWDADGTGQIEFDCDEVKLPCLGHIVENRAITSALLQRVNALAGITMLCPVRLQACERQASGQLRLALEGGGCLQADLVIAADGALSRVRDMMDFKTREWDYGHRAIVCTVELEHPHQDTAWQRFLSSGPLALLPLPGPPGRHYCSIVWSLREDLVDNLLAMDDADFCNELGKASEHRLGQVLATSRRHAFPLRQRHALDYVKPAVALVADAAHTIHPLAGQGINLGLQDVAVLSQEILSGLARGENPGDEDLLRRYQRRRKGENLLMMAAMDGFKRLFEQEALPLRWLRNAGMRGVGQILPLKQQLIRRAMGLG